MGVRFPCATHLVILVRGDRIVAEEAFRELQDIVENKLGMRFAEEKTGIHELEEGFDFLGYTFRRGPSLRTRLSKGKPSTIILPSEESELKFRRKIKELTSSSTAYMSPDDLIAKLNYIIRGWAQYFRYGWVYGLFKRLDQYVHLRVGGWYKKKFRRHARSKKKKKGPFVGSWKWLYGRHTSRDVMGRRRWDGGKHFLMSMRKEIRPIKLMHFPNDVPTLYNRTPTTKQTHFRLDKVVTGLKFVLGMESSVQRHRNW